MFDAEREHWLTTHYKNGKVMVYDSCFSGTLSPSVHEMLVRLYRPAIRGDSLVCTVMPIVQQTGGTDCGLFAIGTAFQAASGLSCNLKQERLREHVYKIFSKGLLMSFPTTTTGRKNKRKHIVIPVYCVCRLPEEFDSMMIQCEKCASWYHYRCIRIRSAPKSFLCAQCK